MGDIDLAFLDIFFHLRSKRLKNGQLVYVQLSPKKKKLGRIRDDLVRTVKASNPSISALKTAALDRDNAKKDEAFKKLAYDDSISSMLAPFCNVLVYNRMLRFHYYNTAVLNFPLKKAKNFKPDPLDLDALKCDFVSYCVENDMKFSQLFTDEEAAKHIDILTLESIRQYYETGDFFFVDSIENSILGRFFPRFFKKDDKLGLFVRNTFTHGECTWVDLLKCEERYLLCDEAKPEEETTVKFVDMDIDTVFNGDFSVDKTARVLSTFPRTKTLNIGDDITKLEKYIGKRRGKNDVLKILFRNKTQMKRFSYTLNTKTRINRGEYFKRLIYKNFKIKNIEYIYPNNKK